MEEKYWNEFMASGKVMDYLYSKGMGICSRIMDKYTLGEEEYAGDRKSDTKHGVNPVVENRG